ncbi:MAG: hypothetical protein V1712_00640 [Patescibacteria group bacterium]
MKKLFIGLSVLAAVILLGASCTKIMPINNNINTNNNTSIFNTEYNFDYSDGLKPWLNHVSNTDINTTFEVVINTDNYLNSLRCIGDNTDINKKPFRNIEAVCLQGNGVKMVVPIIGKKGSNLIFALPPKGGLFEQEYMTEGIPDHFFDSRSNYTTKYFLIPFNGYEIPTYYPIESNSYLPIWKAAFQKVNSIDDNYFNSHIFAIGTAKRAINLEGKPEKRLFSVTYYYQVDWARLKLRDTFVYSLEDKGEGITLEEFLRDLTLPFYQTKFGEITDITKLKPVTQIVSQEMVEKAVDNKSTVLGFDVNKDINLSKKDGQLEIRLHGTANEQENKCLAGTVNLENANIETWDTACRIIN